MAKAKVRPSRRLRMAGSAYRPGKKRNESLTKPTVETDEEAHELLMAPHRHIPLLDMEACRPRKKHNESSTVTTPLHYQINESSDTIRSIYRIEGEASGTKEVDQLSLDIDTLVESLNVNFGLLKPLSENCCIYRVPSRLRKLNEMAYTPRVVSIGPYHHSQKEFKAMEDHKRRYVQDFLERIITAEVNREELKELKKLKLKELFKFTHKWETSLRESYAEPIDIGTEEFVEIMLVDATFIIEYLLKNYCGKWKENDRIFNKQCMTIDIRFDILLIENQIPYFFLKKILDYIWEPYQRKISMIELVNRFLKEAIKWEWLVKDDSNVQHLVHFLKLGLQTSNSKLSSDKKAAATYAGQVPPTISELHRAGVKFKVNSSESLFEIKFNGRILEIPKWKISDPTEILFRNIQAFEQCDYSDNSVSNYIALMDFLINDPEDVQLLIQNGIIENWLKDSHAAAMFVNGLGVHNLVPLDEDFCYSELIKELDEYYKNPWHNRIAMLKKNYFNSPWSAISVIAAAFLLLFTVIQTVCSILQVV